MKRLPANTMRGLILCCLALAACQREDPADDDPGARAPRNADTETCVACGMVIREQPAPRGQVIHRDGTRQFLCSIDDLVQYLDVPSPSGKPVGVFAEVMPDDHGLDDLDASWREWVDADDLHFVTGIERAVMGKPSLTYRTPESARKAAEAFGGTVLTFDQLRKDNKK